MVDLGTWQLSKDGTGSPKCAIWQGAHNAYADYGTVVGATPPQGAYKTDADFPCCGTPFTTTDVTRWPEPIETEGLPGAVALNNEGSPRVLRVLGETGSLLYTADGLRIELVPLPGRD